MKILKTSRSMKKEFKRQLKLAIVAAIGFTIAYAWKETILNVMQNASFNIATTFSLGSSPFFMPLLTTLLGVGIIFITSKLFK